MRAVVAIAAEEPFSVLARLLAYGAYVRAAGTEVVVVTVSHDGSSGISTAAHSPAPDAPVIDISMLVPEPGDVVVFASPRVHHVMRAAYGAVGPDFIQLMASARSVSAIGDHAYGFRLLEKPMVRIALSDRLAHEVVRLAGMPVELSVITPSLHLAPFSGGGLPPKQSGLAINAFDGDGTGLAADVAREAGFRGPVRVVNDAMSVKGRAEVYRASAVALLAPRPGEGICQPALEAAAAGCMIIITEGEAAAALPDGVVPEALVRRQRPREMALAALRALDLPAGKRAEKAQLGSSAALKAMGAAGEEARFMELFDATISKSV
ncbi:MAG: hypothetical protein AAGF45_06105 [Pseudomonadota bacterium]